MTNGQIAQLRELQKCWNISPSVMRWIDWSLLGGGVGYQLVTWDKKWLRKLTHQYRHQIAAMRKNRQAAEG